MQDWPKELNTSKFDESQEKKEEADKASAEDSEDKFKKADANQDGKVDQEEYVNYQKNENKKDGGDHPNRQ